jgi:nucleotide-binding universal stress UspA family protein
MTGTLLIGTEGSERSADAIALGALLAPVLDAEPVLLYAHPDGDRESRLGNGEYEQLVRSAIGLMVVADRSPAAALQTVAERDTVAAIVLGSSHRGPLGRVMPGGVAQRLLAGAPCPVVVAPAGFAARRPLGLGSIGCGFDGSPEASKALRTAVRLAQADTGSLVVIGVHERLAFGQLSVVGEGGSTTVDQGLEAPLAERLCRAVEETGLGADATVRLRHGDAASVLAAESAGLGLLVVGSRGHGPIGSVLLGSVASRLLPTASCPVMVVPRNG